MKILKTKAFTLVELLVVITILAILSVVAYQSFGWATDKAQNVTKKSNIATLWNTLELFNTEKHYYPMPQEKSSENLWWYSSWTTASISNKIKVEYNDQEVSKIIATNTLWGWDIYWTWTWATWWTQQQIWAKWVIWTIGSFNKKYLKKDIYDTQLWDIKLTWETDKKMISYWIWKYAYAIYARHSAHTNWNLSKNRWKYYELAATLKDTEWEWYITYLVWDYSKDNFEEDTNKYPETLILLNDWEKDKNVSTETDNQWIPYPIDGFTWTQTP